MKKFASVLLPLFTMCFAASAVATDFSGLYDQVSASVVTITTNKLVEEQHGENVTSNTLVGSGSGVIAHASGLVITASHVVNLAEKMEVHLKDGRRFPAHTVTSYPFADVAAIQIVNPPADLPVATMGNSDSLKVGEEIVVIGAPHGFSQTLTVGHFSGRPANTGSFNVAHTEFLQTDASINPGNSGGPMFNTSGQVVGIVSHFRTNASGIGFAASSNMVDALFLKYGSVWSGVEVIPMSPTLARALNSPYPNGVLVQEVARGSLAAALGVRPGLIPAVIDDQAIKLGGDILITVGGHEVSMTSESIERAYSYLAGIKSGERVDVEVFREGKLVGLGAAKP